MHPELVSIIAAEMMQGNLAITNENGTLLVLLFLVYGGVAVAYNFMLSNYLYRLCLLARD